MTIREMAFGEEAAVLALVLRGFEELVAPDFSEVGVAQFTRAARSLVLDRPEGHYVIVAEHEGRLLGMIEVRDGTHVCLFFVDAEERGRGIGRTLLQSVVARASGGEPLSELTVNSSPWAVPIYEHLGFTACRPLIEVDGIRAVPMRRAVTAVVGSTTSS